MKTLLGNLIILFPVVSWVAIYWLLRDQQQKKEDWRRTVLHSSLLWGAYLCLSTEVLSLIHGITRPALAVAWILPVLASILVRLWRISNDLPLNKIQFSIQMKAHERIPLFCIITILAVTACVAWLSPPQTWDSLNYHMARVAHWAQDKSIHHFATGIEVQNVLSPGGEVAILHLYILSQSDRWVNFVQWTAMLGCLVICARIAMLLGADRTGQIMASLTTAAIPMGIIQASSSVNDYVVAFWVSAAAAETIYFLRNPGDFPSIISSGLAAGLAIWTKPIAAPYLVPFGLLLAISILFPPGNRNIKLSSSRILSVMPWIGAAIACIILINSGHWIRNQVTYGNPFSDELRLDTHRNQLLTPAGILSNLVRNMAFHTGLPWGRANKIIYEIILELHNQIGLDVEDPRTTAVGPYPWMAIRLNEESAGNTLHAGLILLSLGITFSHFLPERKLAILYGITVAFTMVLFSAVFKWQIFGSRYHMPFFVLFAPLTGFSIEHVLSRKLVPWSAIFIVVCAFPWLWSINSRPIIPTSQSKIGSILTTSRQEILFANALYQFRSYQNIADYIRQEECKNIGLSLSGFQSEYLIWSMLGAPRDDLRLEWFVAGTESEKYRDPAFEACAVICNGCDGPGSGSYNALPLVYQDEEFKLYLATNH